eukprot:gnl/TRDRNA2_/TRDRNA2_152298_c2_seq4.p1 gnl/TRDRNA2_/TRDRNA2_152298_c2~~gnl/TRDRNA2_/TRDRNA2_152298_c2_seq4.p1  ORF type:complete len:336 (+),score=123.62 gnl/TRDRNA2_/TRDRNA2_152298_c2_seq4:136-1143(+)
MMLDEFQLENAEHKEEKAAELQALQLVTALKKELDQRTALNSAAPVPQDKDKPLQDNKTLLFAQQEKEKDAAEKLARQEKEDAEKLAQQEKDAAEKVAAAEKLARQEKEAAEKLAAAKAQLEQQQKAAAEKMAAAKELQEKQERAAAEKAAAEKELQAAQARVAAAQLAAEKAASGVSSPAAVVPAVSPVVAAVSPVVVPAPAVVSQALAVPAIPTVAAAVATVTPTVATVTPTAAAVTPTAAPASQEVEIIFKRKDGDSLGVDVDRADGVSLLVVGLPGKGGVIPEWNGDANHAIKVNIGDRIVAVNEARGNALQIVQELQKRNKELRVRLLRK